MTRTAIVALMALAVGCTPSLVEQNHQRCLDGCARGTRVCHAPPVGGCDVVCPSLEPQVRCAPLLSAALDCIERLSDQEFCAPVIAPACTSQYDAATSCLGAVDAGTADGGV